jgi:hypothetical protein
MIVKGHFQLGKVCIQILLELVEGKLIALFEFLVV